MGDINLKSSENLKSGSILINAQDLKEDLEKLDTRFLFKKKKKKRSAGQNRFSMKLSYEEKKLKIF